LPKSYPKIQNISDAAIEHSEYFRISELGDRLWEKANMVQPIKKKASSMRIDADNKHFQTF
jgi:hypothetical protein